MRTPAGIPIFLLSGPARRITVVDSGGHLQSRGHVILRSPRGLNNADSGGQFYILILRPRAVNNCFRL